MNRLKDARVYLAGPMDRCPNGGIQWRQDITPFLLEMGCFIFDPTDKPMQIAIEDEEHRDERKVWKEQHSFGKIAEMMKIIRNVDLRMVDVSDFIIVNWDMEIQMCGTMEEVFLANREKKPILIHCPQGIKCLPDWLFAVLPYQMMFNDWEELKAYVKHVNTYEFGLQTYNRWCFFNMQKHTTKEPV